MWVAMEAATLSTVLLVTLYRTPASLEAGWKYFILCGVGCASFVWHDAFVFRRGKGGGSGRRDGAPMDTPKCVKGGSSQSVLRLAFVFLLVGTGPRWVWRLCIIGYRMRTRRARRRFGGPLRSAAKRRDLCGSALQGLGGGIAADTLPSRMLMGFGSAVGNVGRIFPLATARHQATFRLLVNRAHGHHHLRIRDGWPGGQFRGPAAYDSSFTDEISDFFTVGHATQKAGSQLIVDNIRGLVNTQPDDWLGSNDRYRGNSWDAAVRGICE